MQTKRSLRIASLVSCTSAHARKLGTATPTNKWRPLTYGYPQCSGNSLMAKFCKKLQYKCTSGWIINHLGVTTSVCSSPALALGLLEKKNKKKVKKKMNNLRGRRALRLLRFLHNSATPGKTEGLYRCARLQRTLLCCRKPAKVRDGERIPRNSTRLPWRRHLGFGYLWQPFLAVTKMFLQALLLIHRSKSLKACDTTHGQRYSRWVESTECSSHFFSGPSHRSLPWPTIQGMCLFSLFQWKVCAKNVARNCSHLWVCPRYGK